MPYFTARPQVLHAIQWTGDNMIEFEAWAGEFAPWFLPAVDNEDGTITMSEMTGGYTLETGSWLSNQGPMSVEAMAQFQEVTGTAPFTYDITGAE